MAGPNRARALGRPRPGDLRALAAPAAGACVSIYLPLEVAMPLARKNALRYAQAVEAAAKRLADLGAPAAQVDVLRERLESVDTDLRSFEHPTRTLAVFAGGEGLHVFGLEPALEGRVRVGSSFALRPLLRAAERRRVFRVLALSVNRVAVYEGDNRGLRERPVEGLPASLVDALGADVEVEALQLHHGADRGRDPIYHGHGAGPDERTRDLERFHLSVARPLLDAFKAQAEPFAIAADQIHQGPLRRELSAIPGLLAEGVHGSPDGLAPHELHARSWPLVEAAIVREERDAAAAFERARNQGKGTDDLHEVVRAAVAGRVHRLWLDAERGLPGRVDEAQARIADAAGDEDALDELAAVVLRRGGEVRVAGPAQLPTHTGVAAQLR